MTSGLDAAFLLMEKRMDGSVRHCGGDEEARPGFQWRTGVWDGGWACMIWLRGVDARG